MKRLLITAAAIVPAFALAAPAAATTYIGTRLVGTATATLSITTDSTIGALSVSNSQRSLETRPGQKAVNICNCPRM